MGTTVGRAGLRQARVTGLNVQAELRPPAVLRGSETRREFCARAGVPETEYAALERRYLESKLPEKVLGPTSLAKTGARVVRDKFGIPHIFASDDRELAFATGFVHAQDRLWQLDYRRRLARGRLAEILGDSAVRSDMEMRTIGLLQAAESELASLDESTSEVLDSYANGVNRWAELAADNLPVEFDILEYEPEPWTSLDSILILRYFWWTLTGRLQQIVAAERLLRYAEPEVAKTMLTAEAGELIVPTGPTGPSLMDGGGDDGTGSNNWVAGPSITTTGKPALASDPHWPVSFPGMWYEQHLSAPGIDCIGAAYPGAPPVIFGRTRGAAWGRTNNVTSTRDLYHEEVALADTDLYRDGDEWARFETRHERIDVRGGGPVELEVRQTRRGPVVNEFIPGVDPEGDDPITLRWVGHEVIGDARVLMALNRAETSDEIRAIFDEWRLSVWNGVYADSRGHFGYQMCGSIPMRHTSTRGTRGTGPEDEWTGYVATPSLPGLHDPERGWVASANNTPASPHLLEGMTGTYADGYRMRRIAEMLDRGSPLEPAEVRDIQSDALDLRARILKDVAVRQLLESDDSRLASLGNILREWDCRYDQAQAGAAVWAALWPRFAENVTLAIAGEYAGRLSAESPGDLARAVLLGEAELCSAEESLRMMRAAAESAYEYLARALGPDPADWKWARAHTVLYEHPLSTNAEARRVFNLGPYSCPGGAGTVNNRRPSETATGFRNTSGVSYRLFVDFAEPATAWGATLTGQSGQPGSPHYVDRVEETLTGEYHPLLMDVEDIEEAAEFEFRTPPESPTPTLSHGRGSIARVSAG